MPTDRDYADSMELVEAVMEWIGMRWTISMIKRELREYFGNDLSFLTCNYLIKAANAEIRKRFNIDPQHYKGIQISFYESIIRNKHEKTKNQLTAAERLDKLFGLEQITFDDPEIQARKIRDALKEMDESIEGPDDGGEQKGDTNVGEGKVKAGDSKQDVQSESIQSKVSAEGESPNSNKNVKRNGAGGCSGSESTIEEKTSSTEQRESGADTKDKPEDKTIEENLIAEDETVSPEITDEIKNLKDEDFKRFRKSKA